MAGNNGLSGSSVCVSALGDPCLGAPSGKFSDSECGSLPAQGGTETMKRAGGQAPEAWGGGFLSAFLPLVGTHHCKERTLIRKTNCRHLATAKEQ